MKNKFLQIVMVCAISTSVVAQDLQKKQEIKYRRSSLHMVMIEDARLPNAEIIKTAFVKAPLSDKYNDHSLAVRSFVSSEYNLTPAEKTAAGGKTDGKGASKMKGLAKGAASSASGGLIDTTDARFLPQVISKYLNSKNIAKEIVAKWYNRDAQGSFDSKLVSERGEYDATAIDKNVAAASVRGASYLSDAATELIGNTFVVVTRFNYVSKKEIYDAAQALMKKSGVSAKLKVNTNVPGASEALEKAKAEAYKKATEGYIVQSTSYLYQLNWTPEVEATFNQFMYTEKEHFDAKKKEAFDTTKIFTMKYIGDGKAFANVPMSLKKKRTDNELITAATLNASDAVIAKLQRDYEVFKTKTPLYSGNPITAKIGLKEGLEAGDKFEVLEQNQDPKTGKIVYKRVGKIKVMEDMVWDNTDKSTEDPEEITPALDKDGKPLPPKPILDRTTFKGGSKFYSGLLLRQIK